MLVYMCAMPAVQGSMQFELLTRTRAIDNQMIVLGASPARCDRAKIVNYGHSMFVDAWGSVLVRASDREQIIHCKIGK